MQLDLLDKPKTYWYEDLKGNEIPWDIHGSGDPFPPNYSKGEVYQHTVGLEVRESICQEYKDPAWPVRFLKWLIRKMPSSWQGNPSQIFAGGSTVNCAYPVIKYLVENRDFSLNEAAVLSSQLCERCFNICCWEVEGHDLALEQHYLDTSNTSCKYCEIIDQDYFNKHRMWCCYRTFKFGGDVAKAYKNVSVYSDEKYMKANGVTY